MTQRAIDGDFVYFVTTNTIHRRHFFVTAKQATLLGRIIKNACRLKHFDLLGYAILPDHVHILVKNNNISISGSRINRFTLSNLLHSTKRNYSRQLQSGRLWKPRFNFRIVADETRFGNTVSYMQFNWQKHGYDARYGESPFLHIDWLVIHNT